jgi:hypothetical protein
MHKTCIIQIIIHQKYDAKSIIAPRGKEKEKGEEGGQRCKSSIKKQLKVDKKTRVFVMAMLFPPS